MKTVRPPISLSPAHAIQKSRPFGRLVLGLHTACYQTMRIFAPMALICRFRSGMVYSP
jgi:hypothetical protein